jgi:integrase
LNAELLTDVAGALWQLTWLDRDRVATLGSTDDVSLADARATVGDYHKLLAKGEDPRDHAPKAVRKKEEKAAILFATVADEYIEKYAKPNKDSWKNDFGYLERAKVWFEGKAIHKITDDDLAEFLDDVAEEAPVSANRTQSVLHTMFKWAKEPGRKYVQVNPMSDMARRGGKEKRRDRFLSDDEIRTLWSGLDHPDVPCSRENALALKLILSTMVRPGQAAGALPAGLHDLHGKDPQWHLQTESVKKRREVIVPLNPVAISIIDEAKKDNEQVVLFPARRGDKAAMARHSLSQSLNDKPSEKRIGIRTFLKLKHFTPHDLRRTAATISRRAGAPRPDVKAMLDHLNGDVTAVYDKYDMLKEKTDVAKILGEELQRVLAAAPIATTEQLVV